MDFIVKDTATHRDPSQFSAYDAKDTAIRMGMVREAYIAATGEVKYVVEIKYSNVTLPIVCSLMTRWGGAQNYEEYGVRPYQGNVTTDKLGAPYMSYGVRVGDVVIVACLNGNHREGIILGGVLHPARKPKNDGKEIAYRSQFNGIETAISTKGSYKLTNNGLLSTALDTAVPGAPPLPEVKNPTVSGTYFELGDDGSLTISDGTKQTIKIDKAGLATTITSGKNSITLNVAGGIVVNTPKLEIESTTQANLKAMTIGVEATLSAKLKAKKIAIGNDAFELLDGLVKLIDALGTLLVQAPNGYCTPLQSAPTWAQVVAIKTQLMALKGSL